MTYNTENLKVTEGQKALAAYINRETGKRVRPESIALVDALRVEFRKDPEQVAQREAVKEAAKQRDLAKLQKALDTARELAVKHGIISAEDDLLGVRPASEPVAAVVLKPPASEPVAAAPVADEPEGVWPGDEADDFEDGSDAPLADVVPIAQGRAATSSVLPSDLSEATDAIVTGEADDGFVVDGTPVPEEEDF